MNEPEKRQVCSYKGACQFASIRNQLQLELSEHEGRIYCTAHNPTVSSGFPSQGAGQAFIARVEEKEMSDFTGVYFSAGEYSFNRATDSLTLAECTFRVGVILNLPVNTDLSDSKFLGHAKIAAQCRVLNCKSATFNGNLSVFFVQACRRADFSGARFDAESTFFRSRYLSHLFFDAARFARPPAFTVPASDLNVEPGFPHGITFRNAVFEKSARTRIDEAAYRKMRMYCSENSNRELEGTFYAYEKRCHRLSLVGPGEWLTRAVSWLYDVSAGYGQSYERALLWLLVTQLFFGFLYSVMAYGISLTEPSQKVAAFTLAQVAKPFELLSARNALTAWPYDLAVADTMLWIAVTGLHSVVSFVLIALFILALRWRFRRE